MCSPACSTSVPTVMATAAGIPALAMPPKSCRRVMDTSVLSLARGSLGRRFQLFCMRTVSRNSGHTRIRTVLEALRRHPCGCPAGPRDGAYERGSADLELARCTENRRIRFRGRRQMDGNRLKRSHLPHHSLFRATYAGHARTNRPDSWNLMEVTGGAGCVRHGSLAAEFVQTPALTMSFVAEGRSESSGIKVSAPRAVLVDNPVIREFRTA